MNRYLLDSHVFLWLLCGDSRLSAKAKEVFIAPQNELFFSMAGYWEICIKIKLGKLELQPNWERHVENEMAFNGIRFLPIHPEHCREIVKLPWHHRDPFDRLMLAQARVEGLAVLSADHQLQGYSGVRVIW